MYYRMPLPKSKLKDKAGDFDILDKTDCDCCGGIGKTCEMIVHLTSLSDFTFLKDCESCGGRGWHYVQFPKLELDIPKD